MSTNAESKVAEKKVLAVSGGIDSMVMLDILRHDDNNSIIVAHFNHGTRKSADDDADFVKQSSTDLGLPCETAKAQLGAGVSEDIARQRRYTFLRKVAQKCHAEIYTAHHLDDLVETVTINLSRGTGWRGLAVLDTPDIRRPFLEPELLPESLRNSAPFDKNTIHKYAAQHKLPFRQDPTNYEDNYLRNRLRQKLTNFSRKDELHQLWRKQKTLKHEIDQLVNELLPTPNQPWQRSWFTNLDEKVALELLRAGTLRAGISTTRPQLKNFRQAILTYPSGKYFNLPGDKLIKLNRHEFYL